MVQEQPPMMYPRSNWTSPGPNTGCDEAHVTEKLFAAMGHPSPTKGYQNCKQTVELDWPIVCTNLAKFLHEMSTHAWLTNYHAVHVLPLIERGLENIVCMLPNELYLGEIATDEEPPTRATHPPGMMPSSFEYSTVGNETWGGYHENSAQAWEMIRDRRFIAGLLYEEGKHWMSFMFDRKVKVFIVWDTLEKNSESRFKRACIIWREYMTTLGFPFNFQAIAVPVKYQRDHYSCGFLSIFNLFLAVRGWVGTPIRSIRKVDKSISLDGKIKTGCPWYHETPIMFNNSLEANKKGSCENLLAKIVLNEIGCESFTLTMPDSRRPFSSSKFPVKAKVAMSKHKDTWWASVPSTSKYTDLGGWYPGSSKPTVGLEREWHDAAANAPKTNIRIFEDVQPQRWQPSTMEKPDLGKLLSRSWRARGFIPPESFLTAVGATFVLQSCSPGSLMQGSPGSPVQDNLGSPMQGSTAAVSMRSGLASPFRGSPMSVEGPNSRRMSGLSSPLNQPPVNPERTPSTARPRRSSGKSRDRDDALAAPVSEEIRRGSREPQESRQVQPSVPEQPDQSRQRRRQPSGLEPPPPQRPTSQAQPTTPVRQQRPTRQEEPDTPVPHTARLRLRPPKEKTVDQKAKERAQKVARGCHTEVRDTGKFKIVTVSTEQATKYKRQVLDWGYIQQGGKDIINAGITSGMPRLRHDENTGVLFNERTGTYVSVPMHNACSQSVWDEIEREVARHRQSPPRGGNLSRAERMARRNQRREEPFELQGARPRETSQTPSRTDQTQQTNRQTRATRETTSMRSLSPRTTGGVMSQRQQRALLAFTGVNPNLQGTSLDTYAVGYDFESWADLIRARDGN